MPTTEAKNANILLRISYINDGPDFISPCTLVISRIFRKKRYSAINCRANAIYFCDFIWKIFVGKMIVWLFGSNDVFIHNQLNLIELGLTRENHENLWKPNQLLLQRFCILFKHLARRFTADINKIRTCFFGIYFISALHLGANAKINEMRLTVWYDVLHNRNGTAVTSSI